MTALSEPHHKAIILPGALYNKVNVHSSHTKSIDWGEREKRAERYATSNNSPRRRGSDDAYIAHGRYTATDGPQRRKRDREDGRVLCPVHFAITTQSNSRYCYLFPAHRQSHYFSVPSSSPFFLHRFHHDRLLRYHCWYVSMPLSAGVALIVFCCCAVSLMTDARCTSTSNPTVPPSLASPAFAHPAHLVSAAVCRVVLSGLCRQGAGL